MFTIQKTVTGNFYHIFNNERSKVNLSDFEVTLDDVDATFSIQCKNGANIPYKPQPINELEVINLNIGTSPIPFSGVDGLRELLTSMNYTPYIDGGGGGGIQSVTGTTVDNTDPINPIVGVPNLTQVLTVQGRPLKYIDASLGNYTFVAEDLSKTLYFYGNFTINATIPDGLFDFSLGVELCGYVYGANVTILTNPNQVIDSSEIADYIMFSGCQTIQDTWLFGLKTNAISSSGGAVDSVNGQTGVVVLDAADVGAEPTISVLPIAKGGTALSTLGTANQSLRVNAGGTALEYYTPAGTAYTFSTGLTETSGTVTNNLSTGVSGGQTLNGGTASGNSLTIQSTTNATKGSILLAPTNAGEVWQGTTTPNPLPTTGDTANHLWGLVNEGTTKQMWSMWAFGSGAGFFQNNMHFYRSRGTIASPTAVQSGDFFKSEGFRGYDGTNMSGSQAAFQVVANQNWTSTARGTRFQFEVTPKLSGSRIGAMTLDSEGLSIGNTTSSDTTLGMTLDVWGNNILLGSVGGAKTRTNAVDKTFRILSQPHTTANGASAVVLGVNNSTANILYVGGGSGSYNAATQLNFYTAANNNTKTGTVRFNTNSSGLTFFGGNTAGTATIEISAGTATVAPLRLNAGTNRTTPQDGAFEFDGTNLYFTTGGVRKTVTLI